MAAVAGSAVAVGVATALLVSGSGSSSGSSQPAQTAQLAKACREMVTWSTPGGTDQDAVNALLDAQGSALAVDFRRWVSDVSSTTRDVAADSQDVQQDCAAYGVPASAWMTGY
jgi:shikimate kinase